MEEQNQTPSSNAPQAADDVTRAQVQGVEAASGDDVARLTQQVADLEAKAKEHYELFLRATAEGENIRRRSAEEVSKAHKFAIENFADNLVPVMDSLQAALADNTGDLVKLREGVELTARQLAAAFERGKIVEVNPVGEKFDPHRHQAISMVPSEQEPNTVVNVLQRGYMIADRVLRPALVTVSAPR